MPGGRIFRRNFVMTQNIQPPPTPTQENTQQRSEAFTDVFFPLCL